MAKEFQSPKGTNDILPDDQPYWSLVFKTIQELVKCYGYQQLNITR